MAQEGFAVTEDGTKLKFKVHNPSSKEIPLLMIIGWGAVKEDWHDLDTNLASDRPVIVFDNRGIGESDVPDQPYAIKQLATDTLTVLNHLNIKKTHVMGISMGGFITQQLLILEPQRFVKAILGCTSHGGRNSHTSAPEAQQKMQEAATITDPRKLAECNLSINITPKWISEHAEEYQVLIDKSIKRTRRRKGILNQYIAISKFNVEKFLPDINHEVLIIHGTDDIILPYTNAKLLESKLKHAKLFTLEGVGHMFWIVDLQKVSLAIRKFLALTASL